METLLSIFLFMSIPDIVFTPAVVLLGRLRRCLLQRKFAEINSKV